MITTLTTTTTATTHRCTFQPSRKSGVVRRNRCRRVFATTFGGEDYEDDDEAKVVAEIENAQREKEEEEDEEEEMLLLNARNQTFEDAVVMLRGGGKGGKEDWEEMDERNVWKTKPVWCQPWTIVLTGLTIIILPTFLFDWKYVSAAFAFPIGAWWYIFLYAYPKSFREGGM